MKIGNIQNIVKKVGQKWKAFTLDSKGYEQTASMEHEIKKLPMEHLEEWFQKRFNKSLDYDQWAGIRDTLETMGRVLYEKTLTIIGDSILLIQKENQNVIDEQVNIIIDKDNEIAKLKAEIKKYID